MNNHDQNPIVLRFAPSGPRYTMIPNRALQNHIEQIWPSGKAWNLWKLVIHSIASTHDLLVESGYVLRSPLLEDLSFLRELAEMRAKMHRKEIEKLEIEVLRLRAINRKTNGITENDVDIQAVEKALA